jgi:hypothetical protein
MKWLLSYAVAASALLLVICSTVVVIARANAAPSTLRALGFELCDGEPCFRGVKPGLRWMEIPRALPNAVSEAQWLRLPASAPGITGITIHQTIRGPGLYVMFRDEKGRGFNPFTLREIVQHFGTPCRVQILFDTQIGQPAAVRLDYPKVTIDIQLTLHRDSKKTLRYDGRLQMNSGTGGGILLLPDVPCDRPVDLFSGRWYGFTSADIYLDRFRRDFQLSP